MIWIVCLSGFLVCLAASAFFSGSETGLYCIDRLRLRLASDRGDPRAMRLQRLLDDEQRALALTLLGTNLANYLCTISLAVLLGRQLGFSDAEVEFYTTAIATPTLFVFGEVLPKNLYQRRADQLLYAGADALLTARRVLSPAVRILAAVSGRLVAMFGRAGAEHTPGHVGPRERISQLLREALADGDDSGQHSQFIERALALGDTPVRAAMIPLSEAVTVPANADRNALLSIARQHPHARLPVADRYGRGFSGVVVVDRALADDTWQQVDQRAETAELIAPEEPISSAILRLQRSGLPMAFVAARDGPVMGIVTVKRLFEQLVGELATA